MALRQSIKRLDALILREWLTRYPDGVIGPYWAQVTPILWIAFVSLLFHFLDRSPAIKAPTLIFVAAGVLPYLAFRQTVTSLSRCLIANRYLRYIKPIRNAEILTATSFVEALNLLVTAFLIFGALSLWYGFYFPGSFAQVVFGFALALGIAISFGQLIANVGLYSDSVLRSVPIVLRPLFWISGIFYSAADLPPWLEEILWYNPLFHVIEIIREGYFENYQSSLATPWYPVAVICVLSLVCLPIRVALKHKRQRFAI